MSQVAYAQFIYGWHLENIYNIAPPLLVRRRNEKLRALATGALRKETTAGSADEFARGAADEVANEAANEAAREVVGEVVGGCGGWVAAGVSQASGRD